MSQTEYEPLFRLAERAANPDISATDKIEILLRFDELGKDCEGVIEVLKLLHVESSRKELLQKECLAWRKVVFAMRGNSNLFFQGYRYETIPEYMLEFLKRNKRRLGLKFL